MPTEKQVLDTYLNVPQIKQAIDNHLSGNSYQFSKVGFLIGRNIMVYRRVSEFKQITHLDVDDRHSYSFYHLIKNNKGWRKVPVTIRGELVFQQGI